MYVSCHLFSVTNNKFERTKKSLIKSLKTNQCIIDINEIMYKRVVSCLNVKDKKTKLSFHFSSIKFQLNI